MHIQNMRTIHIRATFTLHTLTCSSLPGYRLKYRKQLFVLCPGIKSSQVISYILLAALRAQYPLKFRVSLQIGCIKIPQLST